LQTNGRWCGPENIGPVIGWLTSRRRSTAGAEERRFGRTAIAFTPSRSPSTSPTSASPSRRNAPVTSSPLRSTTSLPSSPRGASTRSSASPPDT
jgi:hypothetical protein